MVIFGGLWSPRIVRSATWDAHLSGVARRIGDCTVHQSAQGENNQCSCWSQACHMAGGPCLGQKQAPCAPFQRTNKASLFQQLLVQKSLQNFPLHRFHPKNINQKSIFFPQPPIIGYHPGITLVTTLPPSSRAEVTDSGSTKLI